MDTTTPSPIQRTCWLLCYLHRPLSSARVGCCYLRWPLATGFTISVLEQSTFFFFPQGQVFQFPGLDCCQGLQRRAYSTGYFWREGTRRGTRPMRKRALSFLGTERACVVMLAHAPGEAPLHLHPGSLAGPLLGWDASRVHASLCCSCWNWLCFGV